MILSQLLTVSDAELPCSEAAVAELEFGGSDLQSTESRVPWEAEWLVSLWSRFNEGEPRTSWDTTHVTEEGAGGRKWQMWGNCRPAESRVTLPRRECCCHECLQQFKVPLALFRGKGNIQQYVNRKITHIHYVSCWAPCLIMWVVEFLVLFVKPILTV